MNAYFCYEVPLGCGLFIVRKPIYISREDWEFDVYSIAEQILYEERYARKCVVSPLDD